MTNSPVPNPDRETEINSNRRIWLLWLSRSGLAIGVILLVGIAAGAWWAWNFVQTELAPLVEKNLTESFNRPVRLGKVEQFSLTGLRLGASEIPATPTDTDRATVAAVDVKFDLLRLILDRTLALNVTLVNPNVYLEQEPDGRWVTTELAPEKPGAAFKTEVESIRLQNGNIVLVPQPKTGNPKVAVGIGTANGSLQLRDTPYGTLRERNQRFRFELGGQVSSGGNVNLEGEFLRPTQQLNIEELKAQNLQAVEVDRLLKLPINLEAGRVDANLQVKYNPTQPLSLLGTARLADVTARLPQQPIPFAGTNGNLLFQEQTIKLQNVSSRFGQIPLVANGGLNLQQGYDITAKILNTEIAKVTQTFNFKPQVPLNGEVQADVKLTGAIAQPLLIGQFATTKPTLVDKVTFNNISARFALDARQGELVVANLQAKPAVGGEIAGKGQVKLGTTGGMVFDFSADKVPGDAIAKLYNTNLPASITIGPVAARAQVFGSFNDLRTVARWNAPQATYPGNGEIIVARGQTILRGTTLRVAGGTLQAAAKVANGRWEALVEGDRLPVSSLLDLQAKVGEGGQAQIPPAIQQGIFTGKARLGGSLASFQAPDIQAVAQGSLQVAGGTLQIQQAQLNRGNWDALVAATGVQLAQLLPPEQVKNLPIQPGAFTGKVRATGNLASSEVKDIRVAAQGNLNVAGGTVQIQQAQLNQGNWDALIAATNVQLTQLLSPEQVKNLPIQPGAFTGKVRATGNLASSEVKDIRVAAQGSLNVAGGTVQIQQAQLNQGNWDALIAATNVQLTQLLSPEQVKNLPVQPGAFTGRVRATGNLASSEVKDIRVAAQGNLNVAGGRVQIQQAQLNQGNWNALADVAGVQLTQFLKPEQVKNLPVQPGAFTGRVRVAGNLASTQPGDINAVASGRLNLAGGTVQIRQAGLVNGNWEALVGASGISLASLPQVPPQFRQGRFNGQFRLAGNLDSTDLASIKVSGNGNVQIAGGNLQIRQAALADNRWQAVVAASGLRLASLLTAEQAGNLPIQQGIVTGEAKLEGNLDAINLANIQAVARGSLQTGNGGLQIRQAQLNDGRWQAVVDAAGVQLNRLPQVPNQLQASFTGRVEAAGRVESFQPKDIQAQASGRLNVAGGNIQIQQAQLNEGRWQANINATGIELSRFAQLPNRLPAVFSGQVQAAGNLDSFQPKDIQAEARGSLNIAGGTVQIQQAQLNEGRWQTAFDASNLQLHRLATLPNRLPAVFSGQVQAAGNLDSFQPKDIQAEARGSLNIAGGTVQIQQAQLNEGRWQTAFAADSIQLHRLATLPNGLPALFSGSVQAAGNLSSLQPKDIQAQAAGRLNIAGGTVQIQQARLEQGRWQASVANVSGIQLSRVNNQLRGQLNGENLQLAGNVNSFRPADIQAAGSANFSQGIGPIDGPLAATFNWNGQQLQIQQATAPNLTASGVVAVRFTPAGTPQIGNFDLNVAAQDLNLRSLPVNLPNNIALAGRADFTGRASGTLSNPNVNGQLELRNLVVNNLAFESPLRGNIQTQQGRGVGLDLTGTRDRIAVQLDRNNRPETFLVQRDGAVAEGRRQGDELIATVRNLPIELVRNSITLPPALANQQISGTVSGNFALNLNNFNVRGDNVAVTNAQIGKFQGYQIAGGSFNYRNGSLEITGGELQRGESRYAFTGRLIQTAAGPQFDGRVQVTQGDIQEVLKAARLFNLLDFQQGGGQNYARAAAVQLPSLGVAGERLQNQLRRFSEIEALRQQEREIARQGSRLPTLEDLYNLTGTFSGSIEVANASPSELRNLRLNYDLQGQNWRLAEYQINLNRVIAQGSFANGIFTVSPLRIETDQSLLAFSGNLGLQQQTGQLEVKNFPVAVLRNFVSLPFDLTGNLNANARLSGNLANPQVSGNLELVGGTLNQTPVQSAQADFDYNNARLDFQSQVLVAGPEPINIRGSLPYELPFASVKPDSDRISLDLNIQNEGLALLSLLTRRQVEWISGVGQVQLQVGGTLAAPVPTGFATVQNATLRAQILQEQPLTEVNGTIRFERDRLIIARQEPLQGRYSQGQVIVGGVLPITTPLSPNDPDAANPLTVTLNQLALNLRGLYQGQANGNVEIKGTALNPDSPPTIGGSVELTNGKVFLQAGGGGTPGTSGGRTGGDIPSGTLRDRNLTPEFNNLLLTLGRGVEVAQPPILSFQARGNLRINGSLNDLQPDGTIKLERGQVNLFAAQFNLARNYNHIAEFSPERKLDPVLNVRLVTSVPEVTRSRLPSTNVASEISDEISTEAGALRTVRIQATVIGPASQLTDNLELTSNPPRSREEIVSLIGGGFVQNLGQGTDSTLGLANLAGSVILPGLQSTISSIGQAVGLSELRIFPTAVTSERVRDRNNSTLGLAAEASIDITNNFSASILRILTSNQPTQFNLRYRINNEILIRGSTDFSGDTRGVIEYERRF